MRTWMRSKVRLLFMTCAVLLAIPAIVLADELRNDLDSSFDAAFEVLGLQTGASEDVNIVLQTQGRNTEQDLTSPPGTGSVGENGCNIGGTETIQVQAISSSSAASVKWVDTGTDKVTFTGCAAPNSHDLTVTAGSSAGTANVTFKITSTGATETSSSSGIWTVPSTGTGRYDLNTAKFTVNVTSPNTPPSVSVTGVEHGATYNKGAVPTAGCSVTDTEDGLNSSTTATTPQVDSTGLDSDGLGLETVTCSYTDGGGATETASATYSIVDPSAPVITKVVTGTLGNNGWYTSDVNVDWTVSDPQSPNSLTTNGCDDFSVTTDQDETTYTCSATSAGGTSTDSVTIKRDATDPNVTATADRSTPDHNGWYNHALTVSFTGTDATSGIASCDSPVTYNGPEGTGNNVSGSCTDEAGNSASATFGPFNYDATAPDVTASADRDPDHNGWYNAPFTVSFSGTDAPNGSGNVSCDPAEVNYSGPDTDGDSISSSCTDEAGNSDSATYDFKYDNTDPTISGSKSPTPTSFGWNNGTVTVSYTCDDNLSGVDPSDCGPNQTLSSQGAGQSSTGTATDDAGNTASTTVSPINIDLTNPLVSLVGGPANGSSHYFGFVPNAPTCTASDALSGLDGVCSVSGYGTTVGSHTVKATAKDKAANTNEASNSYTVLGWDFRGFYQPVDMGTTLNTVKGGSTVPIKFELFAGSNELTETSRVVQPLKATKVNCDSGTTEDTIELLATGGTSLRYDTTGGQYIYNWQTPKQPGACYNVTISAEDGSSKTAHFKLK